MLDVLAQADGIHFCDRISRREALQVGSLGAMGLGLADLLAGNAAAAQRTTATFARAKRVILLYMWGGPAHQDTWDLKPDGPSETRGEFRPISTNVPGMHVSEHFPLIARHGEKLAIIRSVNQDDNNHSTGAHAALTGRRHQLKAESFGARETDFPHFGSVLSKLRPSGRGLPSFVALPEVIATTNGAVTPGQGGGLLGKRFDPFRVNQHPDDDDFAVPALRLPEGIAAARMGRRRELLAQVEQAARLVDRSPAVDAMDSFYQQAIAMVLSPEVRRAFDLSAESDAMRYRYGWHTFGQSTLLALRLIEAGVKLVTVYWHREKPTIDTTWDTHALNFQELKNRLMPSVDRPIAALLEDLQSRGLLDETLVIWNSEFGRTPHVNGNAGRDHWGPCNSVVMAGGGIPGGQVYGASDQRAAYPVRDRVTQDDISATVYHLLGLEPETLIHDRLSRPMPLAIGQPIWKLLRDQSRPDSAPAPAAPEHIPQIGAFTRMLRRRGGRFLGLDLGNPDSEQDWQLSGFGEPQQCAERLTATAPTDDLPGDAPARYRCVGPEPATIKYLGKYYPHFAYGWLVLRLAETRSLEAVTVSLGAKPIPLPESAARQSIWQIPIPGGWTSAITTLELRIQGPGLPLIDVALLGDAIKQQHLQLLDPKDA